MIVQSPSPRQPISSQRPSLHSKFWYGGSPQGVPSAQQSSGTSHAAAQNMPPSPPVSVPPVSAVSLPLSEPDSVPTLGSVIVADGSVIVADGSVIVADGSVIVAAVGSVSPVPAPSSSSS